MRDIVPVQSPYVRVPLSSSPQRNQMSAKRRLLKCFKHNPKPLLGFKCTTPSASGSDTGSGEEFEENEEKQREFQNARL